MSGSRYVTPNPFDVDATGLPYAGGKLYFYASGTSTPLNTYSDQGLATPNSNPVIADSAGHWGNIWLGQQPYKVVLKDANDVQIWTADPVLAGFTSGTTVTATGGTTARSVANHFSDILNVKDFGAVGDGSTDDTAAIQAAFTAGVGLFPAGDYRITAALTMPAGLTVKGAGVGKTTIRPNTSGQNVFQMISTVAVAANIEICDLNIYGAVTNVVGIQFTYCSFTYVHNVQFLGLYKNIVVDRGRAHTLEDCVSSATAFFNAGSAQYWSSTDTDGPTLGDSYIYDVNVRNYFVTTDTDFGGTGGATNPALYLRRAVAAVVDTMRGVHLGYPGVGTSFIILENDSQGTKIVDCSVDAAAFGILIQPGTGVSVSPSFTEIINFDADFIYNAGIGLAGTVAAPIEYTHITGGYLTAQQSSVALGIYAKYTLYTIISEVQIVNYAAVLGVGINLENCNLININNCRINRMTQGLVFTAANTGITVRGNLFIDNTSNLTGTVDNQFNSIVDNTGLNPPVSATPAVPASLTPYTNNTGYNLRVSINGGTVTAISINNVPTFQTGGVFVLNVGENIDMQYSVAPIWSFIPL